MVDYSSVSIIDYKMNENTILIDKLVKLNQYVKELLTGLQNPQHPISVSVIRSSSQCIDLATNQIEDVKKKLRDVFQNDTSSKGSKCE